MGYTNIYTTDFAFDYQIPVSVTLVSQQRRLLNIICPILDSRAEKTALQEPIEKCSMYKEEVRAEGSSQDGNVVSAVVQHSSFTIHAAQHGNQHLTCCRGFCLP